MPGVWCPLHLQPWRLSLRLASPGEGISIRGRGLGDTLEVNLDGAVGVCQP